MPREIGDQAAIVLLDVGGEPWWTIATWSERGWFAVDSQCGGDFLVTEQPLQIIDLTKPAHTKA